ncbi:MAG: class I SAM-dependent DNA methyltransferase [Planktomarina sp.]
MEFPLWVPRPVEETLSIYAKWAASYDADLAKAGYQTPARLANALTQYVSAATPILDFGCGTGLSGQALQHAGFVTCHGTDISPEMLDIAQGRGLYDKLWQGAPGEMRNVMPGDYQVIIATGVVSLGAAPPETLSLLIDHLTPGGIVALSFNDPTIEIGTYDKVLNYELDAKRIEMLFREHGPHLSDKNMGSDVIVLKRL